MATPMENNTEGLRSILQIANSLPSAQKYGKIVVFGDSVGEGSNVPNSYSFVDAFSESGIFESVVKACKNSATIGPYEVNSIAKGYDLCSQIERYASDVAAAEIVMCEFGLNDLGAVTSGKVTMGTASDAATATTVCGYTRKAINRILNLNPYAKIHWVFMCPKDYEELKVSGVDTETIDTALLFWATAMRIARSLGCYIVSPSINNVNLISSDGAHPNREGQELLAETILAQLFTTERIGLLNRPLTLNGDIAVTTNISLDGSYSAISKLVDAGVQANVMALSSGSKVMFHFIGHSPSNAIMWNVVTSDQLGTNYLTTITLTANNQTVATASPLAGQSSDVVAREYLYKAGAEKMGLTYGTGASNNGSVITITAASDLSHQVALSNAYNITADTKKLVVELSEVTGNTAAVLGIATSRSNILYFSQLTTYQSSYKAGTLELDLSNVTGSYYPIVTSYSGSGSIKVTNWYFEGNA